MTPLFSTALLRSQSDERLVRLVRDGQERAFEVIVDRYRRPLQRYCERAVPRSRAEDVVQQALMKAWVALRDGAEVRSLRPWLYRITRTTMLDLADTPGYAYGELERSLLSADGPDSELEQRTVIRKTLAGLAALPHSQREALLRTAFEGQSRAQIAEALGVSEGAVRQLLHRARVSLRAAATAVTPLPFVNWLATGPGSAALEGGAAGPLGIAGIAKASAILATAAVVATGSGGVRNGDFDGATKARADTAKKAIVHRQVPRAKRAVTSDATVTRVTPGVSRPSEGNQEVAREAEHGDSQAGDRGRDGESGESARPNGGDGEHKAASPESDGRDEPQSEPAPPPEGDSPGGDEPDPPPDPGSDDSGD